MDVTIGNSQPVQGTNNSNSSQTGVAAVQTQSQKADLSAERVVASEGKQSLENDAKNAEQKKFDLIRRTAANFSKGDNSFLSDVKFTVYNKAAAGETYEIRFTDVSTGKIDIKTDVDLLGTVSAGEVLSGNI